MQTRNLFRIPEVGVWGGGAVANAGTSAQVDSAPSLSSLDAVHGLTELVQVIWLTLIVVAWTDM